MPVFLVWEFQERHKLYTYTSEVTESPFRTALRAVADNGKEENQGPERGEACV